MTLPSATYDNLGRNTSTEHDLASLGFDVVIDEAYDKLGRRTELAAEIDGTDDLVNSYTYDYLNRMTQVTQGSQAGGNVVAEKRANFSYDAEDAYQFTSLSRYADLAGSELVATSTYGYDAADRLTSLTHADGGSSTLAGYTWGYDEGNRLTDFTVYGYSAEDATYTYDDTDQLTGADRSGTSSDESYTYDENGNRTGGSYSTGDNNQILSDGTYNYTYDDEGNRVTKTNIATGEVIEYTWDHRNRLVNITTKTSGGTVTHEVDYTYDIFNRRIGKTIDADGDGAGTATEEIYIYDGLREEQGNAGDHILLAFDESDDLTDRFLYGPNVDQVLASEEVTSTASAGDTLWALTDHLGTVRDVVDYNAGTNTTTVQNHLTYDAFGIITAETNAAVDFLFAFTGRERDTESDLQYNRARYYDSAIGKWISEDPIGFDAGDENLVRYVSNTAMSAKDSSGLQELPPWFPEDPPWENDEPNGNAPGGFTPEEIEHLLNWLYRPLEHSEDPMALQEIGTYGPYTALTRDALNKQATIGVVRPFGEPKIWESPDKLYAKIIDSPRIYIKVVTNMPSDRIDHTRKIILLDSFMEGLREHEDRRILVYERAAQAIEIFNRKSILDVAIEIKREKPGDAKRELKNWVDKNVAGNITKVQAWILKEQIMIGNDPYGTFPSSDKPGYHEFVWMGKRRDVENSPKDIVLTPHPSK